MDRRSGTKTACGCTRISRWAATCHEAEIEGAWPHGFVHIKLLGDLPYAIVGARSGAAGRAVRVEVRRQVVRGHRHKGCIGTRSPKGSRRVAKASAGGAVRKCSRGRSSGWGAPPTSFKSSAEWRDYQGPPAVFLSWT